MGKILRYLFLASVLAPESVFAQQWTSTYLPAQRAGELSVCTAGIDYTNAWFILRFYDDSIDFLFYRDDFTLPYGTELGPLVFEVDGTPYALLAQTFQRNSGDEFGTAQLMQILPRNEDVVDLVTSLQVGTTFRLRFPDHSFYTTSLLGSNAAIASALICWERNQTGPLENNPFTPSTDGASGNNPFETL